MEQHLSGGVATQWSPLGSGIFPVMVLLLILCFFPVSLPVPVESPATVPICILTMGTGQCGCSPNPLSLLIMFK